MNNDSNVTLVDQEVDEGLSILSNCTQDLDDIYEQINAITVELEKTKGFDLINKNNIHLDYNPPIAIKECSENLDTVIQTVDAVRETVKEFERANDDSSASLSIPTSASKTTANNLEGIAKPQEPAIPNVSANNSGMDATMKVPVKLGETNDSYSIVETLPNGKKQYYQYNPTTGEKFAILAPGELNGPEISKDTYSTLIEERPDGTKQYYQYNPTTREKFAILAPGELNDPEISKDTYPIIIEERPDGTKQYYQYNPTTREKFAILAPGELDRIDREMYNTYYDEYDIVEPLDNFYTSTSSSSWLSTVSTSPINTYEPYITDVIYEPAPEPITETIITSTESVIDDHLAELYNKNAINNITYAALPVEETPNNNVETTLITEGKQIVQGQTTTIEVPQTNEQNVQEQVQQQTVVEQQTQQVEQTQTQEQVQAQAEQQAQQQVQQQAQEQAQKEVQEKAQQQAQAQAEQQELDELNTKEKTTEATTTPKTTPTTTPILANTTATASTPIRNTPDSTSTVTRKSGNFITKHPVVTTLGLVGLGGIALGTAKAVKDNNEEEEEIVEEETQNIEQNEKEKNTNE